MKISRNSARLGVLKYKVDNIFDHHRLDELKSTIIRPFVDKACTGEVYSCGCKNVNFKFEKFILKLPIILGADRMSVCLLVSNIRPNILNRSDPIFFRNSHGRLN